MSCDGPKGNIFDAGKSETFEVAPDSGAIQNLDDTMSFAMLPCNDVDRDSADDNR